MNARNTDEKKYLIISFKLHYCLATLLTILLTIITHYITHYYFYN